MFGTDAATANDSLRPVKSPLMRLLRHASFTTTFVGTLAWLTVASTASRATTSYADYTLLNVTAVFDGSLESISGSFTSSPDGEQIGSFQVTGNLFSFGAGYNFPPEDVLAAPLMGSTAGGFGFGAGGLQINFAGLSGLANPVASIVINGVTGTDVTGVALLTEQIPTYSFSSASAILNGFETYISGYFIFDPLTDVQYFTQIQVTGFPGISAQGACGFDVEYEGPTGHFIQDDCGPAGFLGVFFANKLPLSSVDPLEIVSLGSFEDDAPTGFVCPVAEPGGPCLIPEPSSLAILSAALGLLLLGAQAIRRAG